MKTLLAVTVMAVLACAPASAQKLNLDFGALAGKAAAKTEVTLEGGALGMLQEAASLGKKDDQDKADDLGKMVSKEW